MRQHRMLIVPAVQISPRRLLELGHGRGAAARGRLVGRGDQPADRVLLVDRPERHQRNDGRAVRVGDDALVLEDRLRIHLRHDQRHRRVHAERRGIVDHDRAGARRNRAIVLRDRPAGRKQSDIDVLERVLGQFGDGDVLALEAHGLARRPGRGEELQLRHREMALFQQLQELHPHGTRGANHGNDWQGHRSRTFGLGQRLRVRHATRRRSAW